MLIGAYTLVGRACQEPSEDPGRAKTKQPELHRYWTQRDRAATRRLFRLVAEVLRAIKSGAFHPNVGWHGKDCPFRSRCWAWQ